MKSLPVSTTCENTLLFPFSGDHPRPCQFHGGSKKYHLFSSATSAPWEFPSTSLLFIILRFDYVPMTVPTLASLAHL